MTTLPSEPDTAFTGFPATVKGIVQARSSNTVNSAPGRGELSSFTFVSCEFFLTTTRGRLKEIIQLESQPPLSR